jgi:hypothetical protein
MPNPTDIFGNLTWLNKWVKNLLGRIYRSEQSGAGSYKVYNALLTQSGSSTTFLAWDNGDGPLTIGRTYYIGQNDGGADFTSVGAPNNNTGTYFCATGTTPNWGYNPGDVYLRYNESAPVAKVLKNTIGNVYWTYINTGSYNAYVEGNSTDQNIYVFISNPNAAYTSPGISYSSTDTNIAQINTLDNTTFSNSDDLLYLNPIEIRVYN